MAHSLYYIVVSDVWDRPRDIHSGSHGNYRGCSRIVWLRRLFFAFDVVCWCLFLTARMQHVSELIQSWSHATPMDSMWLTRLPKKKIKFFAQSVRPHSSWNESLGLNSNYAGWIVARTAIHHSGPPIFWKHREENFSLWSAYALGSILFHTALGDSVRSRSTYAS